MRLRIRRRAEPVPRDPSGGVPGYCKQCGYHLADHRERRCPVPPSGHHATQTFEGDLPSFPKDLTWACHICKAERPDAKISVASKDVECGSLSLRQNVRYCNDRPECKAAAEAFNLFEG